jgi:hypothetical protein
MGAARKAKKSAISESANGKLKGKDYERDLAKCATC